MKFSELNIGVHFNILRMEMRGEKNVFMKTGLIQSFRPNTTQIGNCIQINEWGGFVAQVSRVDDDEAVVVKPYYDP